VTEKQAKHATNNSNIIRFRSAAAEQACEQYRLEQKANVKGLHQPNLKKRYRRNFSIVSNNFCPPPDTHM